MQENYLKSGQAERGNTTNPLPSATAPVHEAPLKLRNATPPLRLLTEKDMCDALDVGERTFKSFVATGIVPPALELGPRLRRWTAEDLAETIRRFPRRKRAPEPETLARGRRSRIEKLKAQASVAEKPKTPQRPDKKSMPHGQANLTAKTKPKEIPSAESKAQESA